MSFPKTLNALCTPAYVYFIISIVGILMSVFQNIGNNGLYKLANLTCRVPSTLLIFLIKMIYILFWTWVLNLMCKDGYINIAWALVLFPFIMFFIIVALVSSEQKKRQIK